MNLSLFNYIHQFAGRNPLLDGAAIFLASYLLYFLILGFFLLVLAEDGSRRKFYRFAEGALATLLARGLIAEIIYHFYNHLRPFVVYGFAPLVAESGPSFPSGHVTFLFALAMAVWYADKKWGLIYFLLAFVVGLARIYAGVHWPYDIVGGIVIGVLSGLIVHALLAPTRRALYPRES